MPLGAPRSISVYDRVMVGSDGTPTSLHAVGHAAGVANAAEARLVVVSAYRDDGTGGDGGAESISGGGVGLRKELHGKEAAMSAVRNSLKELTTDRVRTIDTRVVPGDPASALLEVAGSNPRNLIVVGNRGLGAQEGELLGSVPAAVGEERGLQRADNPDDRQPFPDPPALAQQSPSLWWWRWGCSREGCSRTAGFDVSKRHVRCRSGAPFVVSLTTHPAATTPSVASGAAPGSTR